MWVVDSVVKYFIIQKKPCLPGHQGKSSVQLNGLEGVVVFKGPGSFTGLRIGITVANALAYSYKISIVARAGEQWIEKGIKDLLAGQNDKIALPKYGTPAKTSKPVK